RGCRLREQGATGKKCHSPFERVSQSISAHLCVSHFERHGWYAPTAVLLPQPLASFLLLPKYDLASDPVAPLSHRLVAGRGAARPPGSRSATRLTGAHGRQGGEYDTATAHGRAGGRGPHRFGLRRRTIVLAPRQHRWWGPSRRLGNPRDYAS